MTNSVSNRVLSALQSGERLTAKQISARYGVANPHNVVYNLRNQGYAIYANERTNSKGEVKSFYRLGTPTRAVVAAGMKAMRG